MKTYNAKDVKLTIGGLELKGFLDADMDVAADLKKVGEEVDKDIGFLRAAYPKAPHEQELSSEEVKKRILDAQAQLEKAMGQSLSEGAGQKYSDFVTVTLDVPPPLRNPIGLSYQRALKIISEYSMRATLNSGWRATLIPMFDHAYARIPYEYAIRIEWMVKDVDTGEPSPVLIQERISLDMMTEKGLRMQFEAMAFKLFRHEFDECFCVRGKPVTDPHPELRHRAQIAVPFYDDLLKAKK